MDKNKVVYIHRNPINNEIFYVGMGNKYRPYSKDRSVFWKRYVKKYAEPIIEIIEEGLSEQEAWKSEIALIELIGRRDKKKGTLVNLSDGADGGIGCTSTRRIQVIDLNNGKIYNSITEASKTVKMTSNHLVNCVNGKQDITRASHLRAIDKDGNIKWKSEDDEGITHKEFVYKEHNWVEMLAYDLDSVNCLDLRSNRVQKKKTDKSRSGAYGGYNHSKQKIDKLRDYIKKIMF